jgi:hypothetical protein
MYQHFSKSKQAGSGTQTVGQIMANAPKGGRGN